MSFLEERETYMGLAIAQAKLAADAGEVPVGAVLVRDGEVVSSAHNECVFRKDPTAHAELLALQLAARKLYGRFHGCTLYVTMEPCAMCAGAIVNAKVPRLVFGAFDAACGCCGSAFELTDHCFLHTVEVWGGVREEECANLLTAFFHARRNDEH